MNKRKFMQWAGAGVGGAALAPLATMAQTQSHDTPTTLAATWLQGHGAQDYRAGLLQLDWTSAQVQVLGALALPSRAHGVQALPDGGFVVIGVRPGAWMVRCDAQGQAAQWHQMDAEAEGRTLDGHVCLSTDGQWLYTTETQPRTSQGWISVRDSRTLRKVAQWRTYGVEPHQVLADENGALLIVNGGIYRAEGDKKRDLQNMDSSLVRVDATTGDRLGQWRLKDQRLGMRHMAWAIARGSAKPLLGIALQNEHDDVAQRRASPVLAVWDGENLTTPTLDARGNGYSGDIVAGPDGGFVLSCVRSNNALRWRPSAPEELTPVAMLQEVGALAPWSPQSHPNGAVMAAARGVGRWHPQAPSAMLKWPQDMVVDHHWAVV